MVDEINQESDFLSQVISKEKQLSKLTGISISSITCRQANFNEDSGWQSLNT